MKIITMDLDNIVLFLSDMDFSLDDDIENLESKFRDIFIHLKKIYNIDISGYYEIDIYKDIVGVVVDINKTDDYFEYYDNQVDMHISIHNNNFLLFEVDDLYMFSEEFLKKFNCYIYHNKFYIRVICELDDLEKACLFEYCNSVLYNLDPNFITQKII